MIDILEERVNLRIFFISTGFMIIGIILLSIDSSNDVTVLIKNSLGASIFTAGLFVIVWDLLGRRALIDEVLAKTNLSKDIFDSGTTDIVNSFTTINQKFCKSCEK